MAMPLRVRLLHASEGAAGVPRPERLPVLEGLSEQTSGEWASWEAPATPGTSSAVVGVQRGIADLSQFALRLPDVIQLSHAGGAARNDESLVELYVGEEPMSVDLTFVVAILGRDLSMIGVQGHLTLEGV